MKKKFVFLSSLPRSGSTLLSRIISQNSKFYATPTSGLLDVVLSMCNNWREFIDHKATPPEPHVLPNVLRGIVDSYYAHIEQPVILDKSRGHTGYLDIWQLILQESPKVIVTIRDLPDIISSMEKLYRKTCLTRQGPYEKEFYGACQHVDGRAGIWTMPEHLIGMAYNRITDAILKCPECLHFIHFDQLTRYPEETMRGIYRFLGEKPFEHDFDNVPTDNKENDEMHGFVDLHETRAKVQWFPSDAEKIIGKALVDKYSQFNLNVLYPSICYQKPFLVGK